MVEDIDKTKHVMGKVFDSPIFGVIAPSELSGGVKTLMLANHYNDLCYNITGCGENCAKWFEYIGSNKDLHVIVKYIMPFEDYSKIYSLDLNRFFKDYDDYARSYINLKY